MKRKINEMKKDNEFFWLEVASVCFVITGLCFTIAVALYEIA
jgi:hypothetical protein